MGNEKEIVMECVDCHTQVKGKTGVAFETMRQHTLGAHGREPIRSKAFYAKPRTLGSFYEDILLLHSELMLAC